MKKDNKTKAVVSDAAVLKATGKDWKQWFALLDKAGANKMSHTEIATWLYDEASCPGWWSQMVAVSYERECGMRVENQGCDGSFQVNVSRTVAAPMRIWENRRPPAPTLSVRRSPWSRYRRTVATMSPSVNAAVTAARSRCTYSLRICDWE